MFFIIEWGGVNVKLYYGRGAFAKKQTNKKLLCLTQLIDIDWSLTCKFLINFCRAFNGTPSTMMNFLNSPRV